jgi:hypothetical protein
MGGGQIVKKKRERKKKNVNLNKRLEKLLP